VSRKELVQFVGDWKVIIAAALSVLTVGAYGEALRHDVAEAKEKAAKVDRIERMIQRLGDRLNISFDDIR